MIMPNRGGGADHAHLAEGWIYESGNPASMARTILDFIAAPRDHIRERAIYHSQFVRTIDEHFADLFAYYEELLRKPGIIGRHRAMMPDDAGVPESSAA